MRPRRIRRCETASEVVRQPPCRLRFSETLPARSFRRPNAPPPPHWHTAPPRPIMRDSPQGRQCMTKVADQKVLVLDFGSQYAQLIARRVRQQQVYCEIVRHDITAERIRELAPLGIDPLRRAVERLRGGGAEVRSGHFPPGHPRAGHLLRHAVGVRGPGRPRGKRPGPGIRPGPVPPTHNGRERSAGRAAAGNPGLDEPRRPGDGGFRRFPAAGGHGDLPVRRREAPPTADLRLAVPSRGDAHAAGDEDPGQFSPRGVPLRRDVEAGRFRPREHRDHPPPRGQRAGHLRAVRRGRFLGGGRPAGPGGRHPGLLHPHRQRPAAQGRGRSR